MAISGKYVLALRCGPVGSLVAPASRGGVRRPIARLSSSLKIALALRRFLRTGTAAACI